VIRPLRWVAVLGCVAVVASACGRASSLSSAPGNGFATCDLGVQPPADVLTTPVQMPTILNRTTVALQDATAWARGMLRALRVEAWALATSHDDLLTSGCLGDRRAQAQLFGDETYLIGMARRAHASITVTSPAAEALTLIELGTEPQAVITGDQQVPSRYAWLVTTRGPSDVLLVGPSGDVKTVIAMQDGERARDLYGGFYVADSWIGPLWFQQSYYSCVSTKGRSLCA
jgi:hypothetical protein